MKKRKRLLYLLLMGVLVVSGLRFLGQKEPSPASDSSLSDSAAAPLLRGDRILAIDVNMAENQDYDHAFSLARSTGMQEVGLYLNWWDIETAPRVYDNPYPEIANAYYPAAGVSLDLTLVPIHTNKKVVPSDLQDTAFDDFIMVERFTSMLDWVFSQMPDVHLRSIVIGSEVDVYLGTDRERWLQYETFYRKVKAHVKENHPDVLLAVEITFAGLMGDAREYVKALNEYSDVIGVSYYLLENGIVRDPSTVRADFDAVTALYRGKQLFFYQLGYPSSPVLGSSEEKQAQFIREVFKAWDAHASQIQMVDFTWLHDVSPESVKEFVEFYGLSDRHFQEFLATLGLRTYDGKDKKAFIVLQEEARARGW